MWAEEPTSEEDSDGWFAWAARRLGIIRFGDSSPDPVVAPPVALSLSAGLQSLAAIDGLLKTQAPRGLQNLHNSCYFNAVLAALSNHTHFLLHLSLLHKSRPKGAAADAAIDLLECLVAIGGKTVDQDSMISSSRRAFSPSKLLGLVASSNRQFASSGIQQDAQELFTALLSLVGDLLFSVRPSALGLKPLLTPGLSAVDFDDDICRRDEARRFTSNPFEGWIASTLVCTECRHERPAVNSSFVSISLPPSPSIEESLRLFSSQESLTQVECRSCHRAQLLSRLRSIRDNLLADATLLGSLDASSPFLLDLRQRLSAAERDVAVVEMLRPDVDELPAGYDVNVRGGKKAAGQVPRTRATKRLSISRAPHDLCLHVQRRFFDANLGRMVKNQDRVKFGLTLDIAAFFSGTNGRCRVTPIEEQSSNEYLLRPPPIEYELLSVVEHIGSEAAGHYITYKKIDGERNVWVCCSDADLRICPQPTSLDCQAFLLFYRKKDNQ